MECPVCKKEMIKGQVSLKGTLSGFLMFGFSQKELYFESSGYEDLKVMSLYDKKVCHHCESCNLQVIESNNSDSKNNSKITI